MPITPTERSERCSALITSRRYEDEVRTAGREGDVLAGEIGLDHVRLIGCPLRDVGEAAAGRPEQTLKLSWLRK
jgi:hypothetical protein